MKQYKRKITLIFIFFLFFYLVSNTTAFSIHNIDFGCVENEEIYERNLIISLSQKDIDNYFVLEKDGNLAPYITIEPNEFILQAGQIQIVKVKLLTTDISAGNYSGWIIARGQNTISEKGTIGYTISLKSNIKANIVESEKDKKLNYIALFGVGIIFLVFVLWRKRKK